MIELIVNATIRLLMRLMARIRVTGLSRIPDKGPLIIVSNHINFFEAPLIYFLLQPRRPRTLAKAETWNQPALRILANLWGAIPLRRGAVDTKAFSRAATVLDGGGFIVIAPEGTRSHHGRLQKASAGVVMLAARTGAPILPIGHWGGERVLPSLARLRRAVVRVRVGRLLYVRSPDGAPRDVRDRELDRIMRELARLLPERYRGYYG
ncbi:MAG: 1-acyl-sn-glycerol-3-phosphate acyltransferase [Spirochaetaceae bacterium]|nr:1-acyl-sn-glycerol-3-phosphate acyltransferase [Spirochaetaceae bacterium]